MYFASPTYEIDGVQAGKSGIDCRRSHLEFMDAISQLGDESDPPCSTTTSTSTSTTTTTTTTTPSCQDTWCSEGCNTKGRCRKNRFCRERCQQTCFANYALGQCAPSCEDTACSLKCNKRGKCKKSAFCKEKCQLHCSTTYGDIEC